MGVRRWWDLFHHLQLRIGMTYYVLAGTWETRAKIILHTDSTEMSLSRWMDLNETLVAVYVAYDTNHRVVLMEEELWPRIFGDEFWIQVEQQELYGQSIRSMMCLPLHEGYHAILDSMNTEHTKRRTHCYAIMTRMKFDSVAAWKGYKRGHDVAVWHYSGNSTLSSLLWPW